ncbi:MAG: response regulator [Anaerolineae bacterium]
MEQVALIVDDDQHTLLLLNEVLKTSGLRTIQAEDGAQALKILETTTPLLLLLDMLMPRISGKEVLEYVRLTPRLDNVFVTIVSAHRYFEDSNQVSRANLYIVKPIRPRDIQSALQQALAHNSSS